MAFINAPGPACAYIPQNINQDDFQIVFSNALPEDVEYAKKKSFEYGAVKSTRWLLWLCGFTLRTQEPLFFKILSKHLNVTPFFIIVVMSTTITSSTIQAV
jgi:hypothetical protein